MRLVFWSDVVAAAAIVQDEFDKESSDRDVLVLEVKRDGTRQRKVYRDVSNCQRVGQPDYAVAGG